MTSEKAAEQLYIISIIEGVLTKIQPKDAEAAHMGMKALEKEMPQPFIRSKGVFFEKYLCLMCENRIHPDDNYCPKCGQKIDWSRKK